MDHPNNEDIPENDVTNVRWADLGVSSVSCRFLCESLNFDTATAVQASTIPLLLNGKDAVVQAMTGSGKTLAYLVPIMERILRKRSSTDSTKISLHTIQAIVIVPTRELGGQVHSVLQRYTNYVRDEPKSDDTCKSVDIRTMRVLGGYDTSNDLQRYEHKGCHILICTPGRLVELLSFTRANLVLRVAQLDTLILDEADQLLSMGFGPQLDMIFARLPKQRQTALFSATQTREIADLTRCGFRQPVMVNVQQQFGECGKAQLPGTQQTDLPQIPAQLENYFRILRYHERIEGLMAYLRDTFGLSAEERKPLKKAKILVYVLTCASVDWLRSALSAFLSDAGPPGTTPIDIFALHGKQKTSSRTQTIQRFARCPSGVLVLTDVGARGLDIPLVDVVIQFDAPKSPMSFIHRIGRTARMGKRGISLAFFDPMEKAAVEYFQQQNVNLRELAILGIQKKSDEERDARRFLGSAVMKKGDWARMQKATKKGEMQRSTLRTEPVDTTCITKLREMYLKQPDALKMATKAFVSFMKGYKEHSLKYIFKAHNIDVVDVCNGFGLFFLPNLSELRHMERIEIGLPKMFENHDLRSKRPEKTAKSTQTDQKRSDKNQKMEEIKKAEISKGQKKRFFTQVHLDEIFRDAASLKKMKKGKVDESSFLQSTGFGNESLETQSRTKGKLSAKKKKKAFSVPAAFHSSEESEEDMLIDTTPNSEVIRTKKRRKKSR